jgi:hypothetical protein
VHSLSTAADWSQDTGLFGTFSENHDQPRLPSFTSDQSVGDPSVRVRAHTLADRVVAAHH